MKASLELTKWLISVGLCLYLNLGHGAIDLKHLREGDLLLVSLPCYVCRLIEIEESSDFSHLGILLKEQNEWKVLEAWGKVKLTPLNEFMNRVRPESKKLLLRSRKKINVLLMKQNLPAWLDLPYDAHFRWNDDSLYCSEFVYKFLYHHFSDDDRLLLLPAPKPMHFIQHRSQWERYFAPAVPPDGELGISPQDFYGHPRWMKVPIIN
jgi:hypothetical protein